MKKNIYSINLIGCFFCFFLLSFFSFQSNAYPATSTSFDTVQKVYIGYYQRAADPGGLIYWAGRLDSSGGNLTGIIEAFANSAESQALYGAINSINISNVVNNIYLALFNRDAETEGRNYYVNGFNSGQFTAATIMLNVLYGAQLEDLQSVNNKLTAANLFTKTIDPELDGSNFQVTYTGDGDNIAARNFLTLDATSVKVPTQAEVTAYVQGNIADPGDPILSQPMLSAPTNIAVTNVGSQTVGSQSFSSSTQLAVAWIAPVGSVDHYEITATESIKQTAVTETSSVASVTLTGLKAATPYSIIIKACQDVACTASALADAVSGTTSAEYWQLQGTGNSYTTMTKAVSDGSVLSWVVRWGAEVGSLANRFQYYYKTTVQGRDGVAIATTAGTSASVATLTSFATDTSLGLRNPCTPPNYTDCASTAAALEINALQAIPLASSNTVRLYLEATALKETNMPTRIYYIDARDGLVGQKFTASTSKTYCGGAGSSDYAPGGVCAFTPVIGVAGDSQVPSPLRQARQFKIGYPKLNSWMWDGAAGTFMVITGDDACAKHFNALYYAVYDGSKWNVVTDGTGCARPLHNAGHGPVLLHLGAAKYKLYFEDATNGQSGKPLHLIYADGASSGGASVDFDDWEASSSAREVNFLWPDGSLLDAQDESGLGDHMILPSDSLVNQFMFVNLGGMDNNKWKAGSAGLGLAVLLNP